MADKYNVRIIRLCGAAGHDKGLIDAMSSFSVKSILRKDIVTGDVLYKNSEEVCLHLRKVQPKRTYADKAMVYQHIDPVKIDAKRMNRPQLPIAGCMKQHLVDCKPGSKKILCREYLCDCLQCLLLDFGNCLKLSETNSEYIPPVGSVRHQDDCDLDADDIDQNGKVFDFVTIPSFVALVSILVSMSVYILKVKEKGIAGKEEMDGYGHTISTAE